ncbi:DUF2877 domain-containing protein [Spirillospora sp. CA-294931]|uniref:DUF2877 domain-containing protein n=1 Tax=Spirillospora sp. CA-294931 TaxID=3240042 RepID=UPI003D8C444F
MAIVTSDAVRLPNSVVVAATGRERPFRGVREGGEAWVGDGLVEAEGLQVKVRRWWDPAPVLGTLSSAALARGAAELEACLEGAGEAAVSGLAGHPDPQLLAESCAAGDLAGAVEAAERIVGLGPGLTPSGDDILAGLLISLRLMGDAVDPWVGGRPPTPPGGLIGRDQPGGRAAWLADWLGAAVTADAGTRTTALAATLLHCAVSGGAGAEVAAVLRAVAGHEPAEPAVKRLLAAGHTSGADLAWGVQAGCRAALALASSTVDARQAS